MGGECSREAAAGDGAPERLMGKIFRAGVANAWRRALAIGWAAFIRAFIGLAGGAGCHAGAALTGRLPSSAAFAVLAAADHGRGAMGR